MSRKTKLIRLMPLAVLTVLSCAPSVTDTGLPDGSETVIRGKVNEEQIRVVSVEDAAPKSPRYSPFRVDHGTLKPGESPTPDPVASTPATTTSTPPTTVSQPPVAVGPTPGIGPVTAADIVYQGAATAEVFSRGLEDAGTVPAPLFSVATGFIGMALKTDEAPTTMYYTTSSRLISINMADKVSTAVNGGTGDSAIGKARHTVWDATRNCLYVAEDTVHRIVKIDPTTGTTTVIAGPAVASTSAVAVRNGAGAQATFNQPNGLAISGNILYVADRGNQLIRAIDLASADFQVTTIAGQPGRSGAAKLTGTETGANALLGTPAGLCISPDGTELLVTEFSNHLVRAIKLTDKTCRVFSGNGVAGGKDGVASQATFREPQAICADKQNVYVGELGNPRIRVILPTGNVSTVLGLVARGTESSTDIGGKTTAAFGVVNGLAVERAAGGAGKFLYVFDERPTQPGQNRIVKVTL